MLYAHKQSLISVNVAEKDGVLITQSGNIPIKKGTRIAHNEVGNPFMVSPEDFNNNYVPVKKVKSKPKYNADDLASAYIEMGNLVEESNINNENYIFEVKDKYINNK
jgi:hypothetical protein